MLGVDDHKPRGFENHIFLTRRFYGSGIQAQLSASSPPGLLGRHLIASPDSLSLEAQLGGSPGTCLVQSWISFLMGSWAQRLCCLLAVGRNCP